MSLDALWPLLQPESRDWLIANNGDALIRPVLDDIARVGGPVSPDAWWVGEQGPNGFYLSDAGIDWIEAVANGGGAGLSAGSLTGRYLSPCRRTHAHQRRDHAQRATRLSRPGGSPTQGEKTQQVDRTP